MAPYEQITSPASATREELLDSFLALLDNEEKSMSQGKCVLENMEMEKLTGCLGTALRDQLPSIIAKALNIIHSVISNIGDEENHFYPYGVPLTEPVHKKIMAFYAFLKNRETVKRLEELMESESPEIRRDSIRLLEKMSMVPAAEKLLKVWERDISGFLKDSIWIKKILLAALLSASDNKKITELLEALIDLPVFGSLDTIVPFLKSKDHGVRGKILAILGKYSPAGFEQELIDFIERSFHEKHDEIILPHQVVLSFEYDRLEAVDLLISVNHPQGYRYLEMALN